MLSPISNDEFSLIVLGNYFSDVAFYSLFHSSSINPSKIACLHFADSLNALSIEGN
jgi:hypothetical protein